MHENPFNSDRRGGEPPRDTPTPHSQPSPKPDSVGRGCAAFAGLLLVSLLLMEAYGAGFLLLYVGVPLLARHMRNKKGRPLFAKGVMLGLAIFTGLAILLIGACFAYFAVYPLNIH